MLTKQEYIKLYEKYEQGHCTKQEKELLESYQDEFQLTDEDWDNYTMGNQELIKNNLTQKLQAHIRKSKGERRYRTMLIKIAAAAILLVAIGLFTRVQIENIITKNQINNGPPEHIDAGGSRATLMLEDGTCMDLEKLNIGELVVKGNVLGSKLKTGQLAYQKATNNSAVNYHTIITPRGGEYQIDLPDGSKVWLNAASSIRFPTSFSGGKREVKITGEVYFEVSKDKTMPFIVDVGDQRITVLGTHFNVNAYEEEHFVQTSLLEGKVVIKSNQEELILSPGQSASFNKKSAKVTKQKFNVSEVLAWQRGEFVFNAENITSIMRKIQRWYDVEVIYRGDVRGKVFSGSISRFEEVREVLDMLALTGTVSFEIKGRRVYVLN